jgi:PAS domain S-box-containing protein
MENETTPALNGFPSEGTDDEKFQTLLNTLKGYEEFLLDANGIIISTNLEAITITGYEEWEVIGKPFTIFYTEEDKQNGKPKLDLEKAAKLSNYISSGFKVKKRGDHFWAKLKIATVIKADGCIGGYRVILLDTTHRAMYSLKTRRIRDEYLNLFNNSFIGIFKFSLKDYSCMALNTKASQLLGESSENLYLRNIFHCESDFIAFTTHLKRQKRIENFEFRLNHKRDVRYGSISCKVFEFGGFIEGVITDVTEKKKQLLELQQLNTELDNFLYRASHDLRAPLLTIIGLANLIQLESSETPVLQHAEKIRSRVLHLDLLMKDLSRVAFNNSQPVSRDLIMPASFLEDIIKPYRVEYPHIQVSLRVEQTHPVYTDFVRISTIVNNIVSNAFKYHNPETPCPYVSLIWCCEESRITISIEDNGKGIDPQYKDDIFNLFFKADVSGSGAGLGLYVVRAMVEKLNGQIHVTSEVNAGTVVMLHLPNLENETQYQAQAG